MGFNESKCTVLHIGHSNQGHTYTMNAVPLKPSSEEKDLCVIIDVDLNFQKHTTMAVNKASRILGLIRKTFTNLDESTGPRLFTSLVCPHLEYGNVIWHPRSKRAETEIEKVQRRATKLIPKFKHLTYEERLQAINLPSLAYRRRQGDIIQAFKIIKGIDRLNPDLFFQEHSTVKTRGHQFKISKQFSKTSLRQNVFSQRIINDWNSLPEHVVLSETVNGFKSAIDRFWQSERYRLH